jgi:ABC-type transport system substrate-binding protein/DNA-binding SARP family transcriptional activator
VEFRILGAVEVIDDSGRRLSVGGPKQRAVLAMLLLADGAAVSRDRLIDGLWAEQPPPSAGHTLDDYLSRLRRALGSGRLTRRPPGYVLRVEPGELDLSRFDDLRRQAREQAPACAAETLRAALGLWRGPALADLLNEPFAALEARRLEDERVSALEDRIDADLALGRSTEVLPELGALVRGEPFRERAVAQLALALYRAGRQAEALSTLAAARRRFGDELGLELGPQLRNLEERILTHDPVLAEPERTQTVVREAATSRGRGIKLMAIAVSAAVAVSAVALLAARSGPPQARVPPPSALLTVDSGSSRISQAVSLPAHPTALAASAGSLWMADADRDEVSRFDVNKGVIVQRIHVSGSPGSLAVGRRSVWVASTTGATVTRIDIDTEAVTQTIQLGINPAAIALGRSGVWIADPTDASLIRLDPDTGTAMKTVTLPDRPSAIAVDGGVVWAASHDAGTLTAVDARGGRALGSVGVGQGPSAVVVGGGSAWVTNELDGTVTRVDERSIRVKATIPVPSAPVALAYAGRAVWVGDAFNSRVTRIDPAANRVNGTLRVKGRTAAVAATADSVVVATAQLARHRGGVLTLLHNRPLSVDPAVNYDIGPLQSDGLTRDSLLTLNHDGGPGGLQLVPDLALTPPTIASDRRTYSFRLRPGIRYSDGRPLRAGDFRRAIERLFALESPAAGYFDRLVGARACATSRTRRCSLPRAIVTDDRARTVTFHLSAPDPDFPFKLTVGGFTAPMPPGTPMRRVDAGIPGTGPYRVVEADRAHVRYERNPRFREWSHAAQPDGIPDAIVWRFGVSPAKQVQMIEEGRADWMADGIPPGLVAELRTRHPAQLHVKPLAETDFFQINTTRPPFDDVRVRRALNLAVDRREIVRQYGGRDLATPTCQPLPPGVPGFRRYCPYRHDLPQALRLVRASGTASQAVTVWGFTDDPTISPDVSRYVAAVLRRLGYQARVKLVSHEALSKMRSTGFKKIQIIPAGWVPDFPSANAMLPIWFRCDGANNHDWFCRPGLDRLMEHAAEVEFSDPHRAARLWSQVDRRLVADAAWVPLVNPRAVDFVSERVRNYERHPVWGLIADQLQLR